MALTLAERQRAYRDRVRVRCAQDRHDILFLRNTVRHIQDLLNEGTIQAELENRALPVAVVYAHDILQNIEP